MSIQRGIKMIHKVKTLYGLYKKVGRDSFLEAARYYSNHVQNTVEGTLSEMESRWYDKEHTITEAEKMVLDYNKGLTILNPNHNSDKNIAKTEQTLVM